MVSVIRLVDMSMTLTAPPADPIRGQDVGGAVGEGEVADRRADPHLPIDAGGLGVDDDELTAAGIGGRDVQALAGRVDDDGVDTDAGAGRDVDGADALGGGVDDGDVDVVVAGSACVDALAVRADGQRRDAEGQRVGRE